MRTLLCLVATFALAAGLAAQGYDMTLYHTDPESLSPEARMHHQRAVEALDHIDTITAVQEMREAAEAAPDSMEMQMHFITLVLRDVGPDTHTFAERLSLAEDMLDAYDRILAQEDAPEPLLEFFEREKTNYQAYLLSLDEQLAERREAGEAFTHAYALHMQRVEQAKERWQESHERAEQTLFTPAPDGVVREVGSDSHAPPGSDAIQPDPRLPLRPEERNEIR